MSDLADWLIEAIAADEEVARAAILTRYGQTGEWVTFDDKEHLSRTTVFAWNGADHDRLGQACETEMSWIGRPARDHIARWDPARVLAECASKRRIVEEFAPVVRDGGDGEYRLEQVFRLLAQPYRDRDGYRTEWDVQ